MTGYQKVGDESLPEVTETVSDAAAQILSQSFAVYRVDAAVAANIRAAHRSAANFFHGANEALCDCRNNDNNDSNETLVEQYQRIVNGNLYGYNFPLPSKELFRTWHHPGASFPSENSNDKDKANEEGRAEEQHFYQQQPWPSNEFRMQSFRVAKDLHLLLWECLQEIMRAVDLRYDTTAAKHNPTVLLANTPGDQLRRRNRDFACFDNRSPKRYRKTSGSTSTDNLFGPKNKQKRNNTDSVMGSPFFRFDSCPLDYFFYHNRVPHTTNCSEHVDRGALVVVCLTNVPGLEVCAPSSCFQCPEKLVHNASLYQERTENSCCSDLVCIMAGDQLSRLVTPPRCREYQPLPACIHRVRNPLKRARLSISYELRFGEP